MSEQRNDLVGHNRPVLAEVLEEELSADRERAQQLLETAGHAAIADDDDAAKTGELIVLIKAHEKHLDAARETRKRPFLEDSRIVDRTFGALIDRLVIARLGPDRKTGGLNALLTAWERRRQEAAQLERERLYAEERRKREEAEAMILAAAKAARDGEPGAVLAELGAVEALTAADRLQARVAATVPQPIRTSMASVGSRREIEFEIADLSKALRWLVKTYENPLRQAARTIIGTHLRSQGVAAIERAQHGERELIPGVEVRLAARAQVRR